MLYCIRSHSWRGSWKTPQKHSMTPKSAKAKGLRLEKLIAKILRESGLDKQAKKQPRSGAFEGFEGDIFTSLPYHFEAKNHEKWKPLEYYQQATSDCPQGKLPIVVMSRNREDMFAFLRFTDLVQIMQLAQEHGTLQRGFSKAKQTQKRKADEVDLLFSKQKQINKRA